MKLLIIKIFKHLSTTHSQNHQMAFSNFLQP